MIEGEDGSEGGGGFVLAIFVLDWYNFRSMLQHEVDLAILVGVVTRLYIELTTKLLQNVILSQRTFELVTQTSTISRGNISASAIGKVKFVLETVTKYPL